LILRKAEGRETRIFKTKKTGSVKSYRERSDGQAWSGPRDKQSPMKERSNEAKT